MPFFNKISAFHKDLLCFSVYFNEQFIFTELFIIKFFNEFWFSMHARKKSINYGSRFHGNHKTVPFYVQGQIFELIERLTTSQTCKQTLSITHHQQVSPTSLNPIKKDYSYKKDTTYVCERFVWHFFDILSSNYMVLRSLLQRKLKYSFIR